MIDTTKYNEHTDTKHTTIKEWTISDHVVAWMKYEGINIYGEPYQGEDLYCECDFKFKIDTYTDKEGKEQQRIVRTTDGFHCEAKKTVRLEVKADARKKYGNSWKKMGKKRAVLNIFHRVQRGEWLGQRCPGIIYVQEVAELLEKENREILKICDDLFKEEKLDLNGYILTPYVKRFRFPKEIQNLFAYIKEEPLGWPNGDAGDGFVYALEKAINDNTSYSHGREAFYEHNYPNISPDYLLMFGLMWVNRALVLANNNPESFIGSRKRGMENTAKKLRALAELAENIEQKL